MPKGLLSRWPTHRWPMISLRHGAIFLQVIQNLSDGHRISDGSHDLDVAAVGIAVLNLNVES